MAAIQILAIAYAKLCPERTAEMLRIRREKRQAMSALVTANMALRDRGFTTDEINHRLSPALRMFDEGSYDTARSWAEMAGRKACGELK